MARMQLLSSLFISVLFLLAVLQSAKCEGDVTVLTDANFEEKTKEGSWLVEFYAPWCGHCKKLAPTWEEFATAVKGDIHVGKVDCTVEKSTAQRFGIRGYPTIKFVKDGKFYDYQSARTVESFTKFAKEEFKSKEGKDIPKAGAGEAEKKDAPATEKKPVESPKETATGPSDVVVLDTKSFDEKVSSGDWLVEFYAPWCGHCKRLAPIWDELATKSKGKLNVAKVDCTVEKDISARFGIRGFPTIKLLKGGKVYDFKGQRTIEEFTKFAEGGYSGAEAQDLPKKASSDHDEL